jgi:serine/threonine protein kinase
LYWQSTGPDILFITLPDLCIEINREILMSQSKPTLQPDWVGHTIAGRYKLETVLGRGGMSTVYKATDPNLRRPVAVKLIHTHLSTDPNFVRRFEQEAAAVAQLRHPNIIQVYDFDHEGEIYYMVLEFVAGETLQERLKSLTASNQSLSVVNATQLMITICDAVAYAHEHGMIHRDLKPANVMLNPQGEPILMDFGVAKMLDEAQHTATGTVVGTAKYMSPEQARGVRPDERADIYSLGVMFYEMATGQPPFDGESAVSIMMKHVNDPVPDISQIQNNVPDELIQVIQKSLAKTPEARYQTAAEMGTALQEVSRSLKETTLPSPRRERESTDPSGERLAVSTKQSNQLALWLVGVGIALVLIVFGVVALFVMFQFTQFWRSTEEQILTTAEEGLVSASESSLPSSERMVRIRAGTYAVGLDESDNASAPSQQVKLTEFWIDQYEVTNAQYEIFLNETDSEPPSSWVEGTVPTGQENHPVEGITWDMAAAYCQWAKKRLPTEAEWEVAARGPKGLLYPWGNEEQAIELPRADTYAVGSIAQNRSPFGIFDMGGNVWEWVDQPYAPVEEGNRVLRGGAHGFLQNMAYRLQGDPNVPTMSATAGIRCAADEVRAGGGQAVLVEESFTDPESGWPDSVGENQIYGYHPPDFYHVEVSVPGEKGIVSRGPTFDNVAVESNIFVAKTDTDSGDFRYGLVVRRTGDQFYAFTISPRTKTWYVLKSSAAGLEVLDQGSNEFIEGFSQDTADVLRVDADGANFAFHINGQPGAFINDADYTTGEVGFFVETFDESMAHIHYDTLSIQKVVPGAALEIVQEGALSHDSFTDPNSGWPELAGENQIYGYHPPDFYHVEVSVPHQSAAVSRQPEFEDVTVEGDIFVAKTDTEDGDFRYGLALRRSSDEEHYYAFAISPRTQTWYVLKKSANGLEVLDQGTDDSIQGQSQDTADKFRVDAKGSDFIFYLNGQPVSQINDEDYTRGEVGFFVETFDETLAHIHYDTLTIREVENP